MMSNTLPITRYRPKGVFRGMGLSGVSGFLGVGVVMVDAMGMLDAGVVEGMGFCYITL